jgi:hypothetical protein
VTFTFHPWGATQVQLYAGSLATFTVLAHLQARNFKGEIVDMSGPKILGGGDLQVARACQTLFKVSGPAIASVTLTALGVDESKAVVQPIQVIDDLEFEPAKLIAGPPAHRPEIIHVPWFEHGVDSLILAGIRLGEGGVWLGPHGEPHPVPPIRPEERAILAAFVANGVAEMISDAESRRAIQRAALGVIAREANQMSERL